MRIGIWSFAHPHALSYLSALQSRNDQELVGITDDDPARGRRLAQERGVRYLDSAEELLAQAEAVIIASANADHARMAIQAAEAGVHALVEKPLAAALADARAMIQAFARRDLVLATAFPCPFSPAFVDLDRLVRARGLGRILALKTTNRGSMPGGFFIQLERSGGGAVIDHTVHVADLLRRLMGASPTTVHAEIGHGLFHQDWDDSGLLTLDFEDGAFATLDCSWSRPMSYPTWGDVTLKVVGERGNASADLFGQRVEHYPGGPSVPRWQSWGTDLDALMIDDFCAAVRDGRAPRSTGEDGLAALKVALGAYRSAELARPVALGELD